MSGVIDDAVDMPDADTHAEVIVQDAQDAITLAQEAVVDASSEGDAGLDQEQAVEVAAEPEIANEPVGNPVPVQNITVEKVGFGRLVAGGAVAAGLGYLAAWFNFAEPAADLSPQLAEQTAQIAALDAQIAALPTAVEMPEAPDLAPLETSIAELRDETTAQFAGLSDTLSALETRLTDVERAPSEDGGVSDTAITSIERELTGLRDEIAAQQSRIQDMADGAAAELAAAQEQTAAVQAEAQAAAEEAQAQAQTAIMTAALAELRVALETGAPFEDAVADLIEIGVDVPNTLTDFAAEGVPKMATLQDEFPDLARTALATARSEGVAEAEGGGIGTFLRSQFDVRSVEPREGDDPDAILSRAEAAIGAGNVPAAVSELTGLPDPVRSTFDAWLATAEARSAALAAAAALDPSVSN